MLTLRLDIKLNTMLVLIMMILNFKLVFIEEYQNRKNIFTKGYISNWSEEVFLIKINYHKHMLLMLLMGKKLLERFKKMNCKKQIKKNLR